ncbi:MAG: hypothetical protein WCV68_03020 [Candidatus Paceibacterota bacterium]
MNMMGTNPYGWIFYGGALIVGILLAYWLYKIWRSFLKKCKTAIDAEKTELMPSIIGPAIISVIVVVGFISAVNVAWNVKQSFTTSTSHYQSPAEIKELEAVKNSQLPTKAEMEQTAADAKKLDTEKHEDALSDFDKAMKKHDADIQQRTGTASPASPAK